MCSKKFIFAERKQVPYARMARGNQRSGGGGLVRIN